MRRKNNANIINFKSRRNKKRYKKFYGFVERIKFTLFSKKDNYSLKDTEYKKPANI